MGRTVQINGKNIQNRSTKTKNRGPPRNETKVIKPYKMPESIYEGFVYHKRGKYRSKSGRMKTYLRCKFESSGCPGKGQLDEATKIFTLTHNHNDICRDPFALEKASFRKALFENTKKEPGTLKTMYESAAKAHPASAQLSAFPNIKTSANNWRNASQPTVPKHMREIADALKSYQWLRELSYEITFANVLAGIIEEKRQHTIETWAVNIEKYCGSANEGSVTESHVVFGSPTFAMEFIDSGTLFIDATFDVVPNIEGAYQLLTVMIEHLGEVFPVAWALMSRKTEDAYLAVLKNIKENLLPGLRPRRVVTDFETALQNSIAKVFPDAVQQGCFFHYCHALLKRRQKKAVISLIKRRYPEYLTEAYLFERNLMNLSLLPEKFIIEAFDMLENELKTKPILAYVFGD